MARRGGRVRPAGRSAGVDRRDLLAESHRGTRRHTPAGGRGRTTAGRGRGRPSGRPVSPGEAHEAGRPASASRSRCPGGCGIEQDRIDQERTNRGEGQEAEDTTQRQPGGRAHQGDVQQYDGHDHRPQRRCVVLGLVRDRRLQGEPQEHPVRGAACGRDRRGGRLEVWGQGGRGQGQGAGLGRESAITAIQASGLSIKAIEDVTPLPHNGCRPPKKRRV